MPGARILVVLSAMNDADAVVDTVLDAQARAAHPLALRFALPVGSQNALSSIPPELFTGSSMERNMFFYREENGLKGALAAASGYRYFLSLRTEHRFAEKWDRELVSRFRKLPAYRPLLTASAAAEDEENFPQIYLPAFTAVYGRKGVLLGRGLPLVCPEGPVKTMAIDPLFLFGRAEDLLAAELTWNFLSFSAFVAEYQVYALEAQLIWPACTPRTRWLPPPADSDATPGQLARFEQFAGIDFKKSQTALRSTLGLFAPEDGYAQRMPRRMSMRTALRQQSMAVLAGAGANPSLPLVVTAFGDLPDALKPMASYMIRFSYLQALKALPLLLYAGGRQERNLKASFPNTFSYPLSALLPKSLLSQGMLPMQYFKRNQWLLLCRAARAHPEFSHLAWVDFDSLPHPICPEALPDFSALMDDKIHLAKVNDAIDTAMVLVPRQHMKLLEREVLSISHMDAEMKRSFSERSMLRRLLTKFPDLFTVHPMPQKGLLFLQAFEPQLLSLALQAALKKAEALSEEAAPTQKGDI